MKQISFVIPCYNSQDYMEKCIESLLPGGSDVEIIIIDDGSTDNTLKIAKKYERKYNDIVRVHHQENGGHGEGINQGLRLATGRYFKVIDSDDWADPKAYKTLLKRIKKINSDVIIMNYVYRHADKIGDKVINFSNVFEDNKEITWDEIGKFKITQYLTLHNLMYKKEVLDKTDIDLPKHTFYEDNLFIYLPLVNTKTLYYMNLDFYQYFIGREGQSVQQDQLIKKASHQRLITELVCNKYDLEEIENKKLRKYMYKECSLMIALGSVFTRMGYTAKDEKEFIKMMDKIEKGNPKLLNYLLHRPSLAFFATRKGKLGRAVLVKGYKVAHKLVKFN